MKKSVEKLLASLLVAAMILTVAPFSVISENISAIKANAEEYEKEVTSIEIEQLPDKTDYYYEIDGYENYFWDELACDGYDYFNYSIERDGLIIKINYSDGSSELSEQYNPYDFNGNEIKIEEQQDGEIWNIGKHNVTVIYMEKSAVFSVNIIENPVKSIELLNGPDNDTLIYNTDGYYYTYEYWTDEWGYKEKEIFEYSGFFDNFELKYNLKDGTSVIGDENYFNSRKEIITQEYGEEWNIGNHTATLCLMDYTVEFVVKIVASPLKSIKVVSLPTKTEYFEGVDGSKETYIEYGYDEYGNLIEIEHEYYNCNLDTDGLKFELQFNDGTKKTVDADYHCEIYGKDYYFEIPNYNFWSSDETWQLGENIVNVSFMGKSASFKIYVSENPFSSIEFTKLNIKDSYMQGEYVDLYGSEIKVNNKNGDSQTYVIDENSYYDGDWNLYGGLINGYEWRFYNWDSEPVFEYLGFLIPVPIKRNNKTITGFKFITEPKTYTAEGSQIQINFSDGTSATTKIKDYCELGGCGDIGFVTVGGAIKTPIGVFAAHYTIANYKNIDDAVYKFGFGLENFENGCAEYITSTNKLPVLCYISYELYYHFNGYNYEFDYSPLQGIYYNGEINDGNIDSILFVSKMFLDSWDTWNVNSSKAAVLVSALFNVENVDLSLSKYYDKNTDTYTFPMWGGYGDGGGHKDFEVKTIDGNNYIKMTYGSDTYYFVYDKSNRCSYVGTVEKDVSNLEVISNPFKDSYFVDDVVNADGLKLKYTDKYGKTEVISSGFDVKPSKISADTNEITVSYNNKTVSVPIEVIQPEEVGIELTAPPAKLNYLCGNAFNPSGLQIAVKYNNGSQRSVIENVICSPKYLTVPGNQTITVYYHGFTTTFSVSVKEKGDDEQPIGIAVSVNDISLDYKSSGKLNPVIEADNGVKYKVEYKSSNTNIVTVDNNGNVYAAKKGNATITCTVTDEYRNKVSDTCNVSVNYAWWQWIIKIVLFGWIWY